MQGTRAAQGDQRKAARVEALLHGPRTDPRDEAPTWAELDLDAGEVRTLDLR